MRTPRRRDRRGPRVAMHGVSKRACALYPWAALTRFPDDGRLCTSNNAAERALRVIPVGATLARIAPVQATVKGRMRRPAAADRNQFPERAATWSAKLTGRRSGNEAAEIRSLNSAWRRWLGWRSPRETRHSPQGRDAGVARQAGAHPGLRLRRLRSDPHSAPGGARPTVGH